MVHFNPSLLTLVERGGLDKEVNTIISHLYYIFTCDIFSPGLSRLSILHIPNSYPSVTEYLHPMLENNISTTLTYLLLYFVNIISWTNHIKYRKYGIIFNIMDVILEEFLLRKFIRFLSHLSHILNCFLPFVDKIFLPS